jgi:UDP-N-acetylglucosamine--N-acetylmuramyl-(pentapeptide) pyrophosphoryl-undecaprenol N-acetylglucosamine transferase
VTEDPPLHVVLAGGGSAGHIEPALALADALLRRDERTEITCLGTTRGGLDTKLIPARGYPLELIPAVPMPRKPTIDVFTVPSRLAGTVRRTVEVLDQAAADVVVGFGGHVALPAYFAARRRSVPIVVHEANVRPGLANRIGARMTDWIATGSPDCRLGGGRYLGMPLRQMISKLDRRALRDEAVEFFGLKPELKPSSSPAARSAHGGSTRRSRTWPRRSPRPACRSCTRSGAEPGARTPRSRSAERRTCAFPTWTGWISRTPPRTRCSVAAA